MQLRQLVAPFASAAVLAVIGAAGVWAGKPWLVASLGAAALLQILTPHDPAARPWNTAVGQLVGLAAGFIGVYALAANSAPPVAAGEPVVWIRVASVALAIGLTAIGQTLLGAGNASGGSTALLIALGKIAPTLYGAFLVVIGIALVTILGEAARYALLRLE